MKTEKGEEEIKSRKYSVPLSLRHVLILIDGKSNAVKILEKGRGLPDIMNSLDELVTRGLIEALPSSEVDTMKADLIKAAKDILGAHAERVIKKVRGAPDTREGMMSAIDGCRKVVKLTIDERKAEDFTKRCSEILSRLQ
ncbi:MAG TPA: hypothetical protein ENH38_03235 [Nitrospirae bacterium]|nr:hypothetical protein [Nitrospirota bacterium]HDZ87618.1 hypothetical protein [Nitrospirota bacterium]